MATGAPPLLSLRRRAHMTQALVTATGTEQRRSVCSRPALDWSIPQSGAPSRRAVGATMDRFPFDGDAIKPAGAQRTVQVCQTSLVPPWLGGILPSLQHARMRLQARGSE